MTLHDCSRERVINVRHQEPESHQSANIPYLDGCSFMSKRFGEFDPCATHEAHGVPCILKQGGEVSSEGAGRLEDYRTWMTSPAQGHLDHSEVVHLNLVFRLRDPQAMWLSLDA